VVDRIGDGLVLSVSRSPDPGSSDDALTPNT
jgi:hypothetical protein